jgi:hypothetical protein
VSTNAPVQAAGVAVVANASAAAVPLAKAPAPVPATEKRRAIAPPVRTPRKDLLAGLRAAIQARPRKERVMLGWGAAAIAVIAVVAAAVVLIPPAATLTGVVTIDAVPWATITRIEAEDGRIQPLPSMASTPLALTLPVGTYRITLAGPPPDLESRVVTAQVQAGGTATLSTERFRAMTPDEYFEAYLTAAAPSTETATGAAGALTPPVAGASPAAPAPQGVTP